MKYPLEQLYEHRKKAKPKLTEAVFSQFKKILSFFQEINFDIYEDTLSQLDELKMSELYKFISKEKQLTSLLYDWVDLDVRVENSLEYELIETKAAELKSAYRELSESRRDKELKLKTLFSAYLEDLRRKVADLRGRKIETKEITYNNFKDFVNYYLGEDCIIKNLKEVVSPEDLFESIKTDALINSLEKEKIIYENNGVINVMDLEETDIALYEHLREEALKNFKRQHIHTDDEVRFVVDGCGIFYIFSDDNEKCYEIVTKAGDLIVIPANKKHAFELTSERNIRCIRLFTNDQGWKAIYT